MEKQDCPKCGSNDWKAGKLLPKGVYWDIKFQEEGFLKVTKDTINAFVCGNCGYIELFAEIG